MGLKPSDLISRVRYKIVDPDAGDFADAEILLYLNEGGRVLHGMVADRRPAVVGSTKSSAITSDAPSMTLDYNPRRIYSVRLDGYVLPVLDFEKVRDATQTGMPGWWYLSGFKAVTFFPTPVVGDSYTAEIKYVPEYDEMALADESCVYPDQALDLLVEYAVIRAGMRNEADVSQETAILRTWRSDVQAWLGDMAPIPDDGIEPYW